MNLTHRYVAFVAGRGIVPVLPLIETLLSRDAAAQVQVFYGNRDREGAAFAEQLLALKDRYLDRLALHFVMSAEPQDIEWLNGRLDAQKIAALSGKLFDPTQVRQFLRMRARRHEPASRRSAGADWAWMPPHIRAEAYEGSRPSPTAAAAVASDDATQVTVVMDGRRRSFSMRPGGDSILDAAAQAGIDLPFSCKAGVCSTCRTKLVTRQSGAGAELRSGGLGARAGIHPRLPGARRRPQRSS